MLFEKWQKLLLTFTTPDSTNFDIKGDNVVLDNQKESKYNPIFIDFGESLSVTVLKRTQGSLGRRADKTQERVSTHCPANRKGG